MWSRNAGVPVGSLCSSDELKMLKNFVNGLYNIANSGKPFVTAFTESLKLLGVPNFGLLRRELSEQRQLGVPVALGIAYRIVKAADKAYGLYKSCIKDILDCNSEKDSRRVLQVFKSKTVEREDRIAAENFNATTQNLASTIDVYTYIFGGKEFFEGFNDEIDKVIVSRVFTFIVDTSDEGHMISEAEGTALVSPPLDVIEARLIQFIARWNRSLEYSKLGYFSVADLPDGFNPDFIELDVFNAKMDFIRNVTYDAALQGYSSLFEMWVSQRDDLRLASERQRSGICAKVRVQLKQRAVLVREGFEAELQLENNGDIMSSINITIVITNLETGEIASNLFSVGQTSSGGLSGGTDGDGSLAPATSGYATWLILPYDEAAPVSPERYNVGGSLEYLMDGKKTRIDLFPDSVEVSPSPRLQISYFHEYEIYGDDLFTTEIEPSVPYHLAVLIRNEGYGNAIDLRLESAQPEIIENEKGPLIDFTIIGAEVNGKPTEKTLVMEFEDIPAQSSKVGTWTLVSTLQGQFSDYTADFVYKGPLDDDRLALIESIEVMELTHLVKVDTYMSTRSSVVDDGLDDFLINKFQDIDNMPDTLVSSHDGSMEPVFVSTEGQVTSKDSGSGNGYTSRLMIEFVLPTVPDPLLSEDGNWFYFRMDDPLYSLPDVKIHSVLRREDGSDVLVGPNVWQTSKTKRFSKEGKVEENFLHILDFGQSSGKYEVRLAGSIFSTTRPSSLPSSTSVVPVSTKPTTQPSTVQSSPPTAPPSGNGNGDPHFTTFSGKSFDYHGECDLVMMSSRAFASGSGLAVHVRTTRVDSPLLSYSYIFGAAVGIGKNNVMEVQVDGTLVINGRYYVAQEEQKQKGAKNDKDESDVSSGDKKSDQNGVTPAIPETFATYPLVKNMIGKKKRIVQYVLSLTDNDQNPITITIHANPRTHMLYVKIDGDINDGVGLLGHPHAGDRLMGRDGVTDMSQDWDAYGEEWQVRDFEPKLFQDEHRSPQYPSGCVYESHQDKFHHPKQQKTNLRRRLFGKAYTAAITLEDATNACGDYIGVKKKHCVHDVMAMGDLEVADDPAYE